MLRQSRKEKVIDLSIYIFFICIYPSTFLYIYLQIYLFTFSNIKHVIAGAVVLPVFGHLYAPKFPEKTHGHI